MEYIIQSTGPVSRAQILNLLKMGARVKGVVHYAGTPHQFYQSATSLVK